MPDEEIEKRGRGSESRYPRASAEEVERVNAEVERLSREASELTQAIDERQSEGSGLPARREEDSLSPEAAKAEMARLRSEAVHKQKALKEKSEELKRLLDVRLREAQAALEPLQRHAKRLEEGIHAVSLYLGREEQMVEVSSGDPAPSSEPITVRQLVLAMDQECAVAAEEGGIDAVSIEEFDAWLASDPAHVQQVIPEPKSVVALVPRFGGKDYGESYKTTAIAEANKQTYFLVRNGDNLYRIWTDFEAGRTLVPAREEFTRLFEVSRYDSGLGHAVKVRLEPGSREWARAEEAADTRKRHYMRAALILQGLADRTAVFHPLPHGGEEHPSPETGGILGASGINFLSPEDYDAGRLRIVLDGEGSLTEAGYESFRDWQRRLNAELRSGMRVVGNFRGDEWRAANDYERGLQHSRLTPPAASAPQSGEVYEIEKLRISDGALIIRYERNDEVWDAEAWTDDPDNPGWGWRGEYRKPRNRASCVLYPRDRFLLPFDLAGVDEMRRFLAARTEREDYLALVPLLKAAISAKKREEEAEEPFREMLAGYLAREYGVGIPETTADVPDLVRRYKYSRRHHRPLVGDETENAKALHWIASEYSRLLAERRREEEEDEDSREEAVDTLRAAHPRALLIARKRSSRQDWVVLDPEIVEGEPEADVFVSETLYSSSEPRRAKEGERQPSSRETRRWRFAGARADKWRWYYHSPRWERWERAANASEYLAPYERERLAGDIASAEDSSGRGELLAVCYLPQSRCFGIWTLERMAEVDEQKPLTGRQREPEVGYRIRRWSRNRHGEPRAGERERPPSRPLIKDGAYPGLLLAEREETGRTLKRERESYQAARDHRKDCYERLTQVRKSISEAWEARAEREEYLRFVEDYGDPTLWEDHKKALSKKLSFPHHGHRGLEYLLSRLIEGGYQPESTSIKEARDTARRELGVEVDIPDDLLATDSSG